MQFNKVLVVGLGQLGLPVAKYVKEKGGFDAYGYDINTKSMDHAEKTVGIKKVHDDSGFSEFDVFVLCVSTHKPNDIFSPQIDALLSIVERISKEAKNGALVTIESTIPKGTSRKVLEILNHRLHVAHAPHRWYALEQEEHGVKQLRVVGGVYDCCLETALQFYNGIPYYGTKIADANFDTMATTFTYNDTIVSNHDSENRDTNSEGSLEVVEQSLPARKSLGIPMHPVSDIEIAELTKIAENAHRYLQIAFAEDLYLYCQANNINFPELRDALNTKWNVHILEPREGIGGHCLPKDTKMFLQSSQSLKCKILTAAMEVDEDYRRYREFRIDSNAAENVVMQGRVTK
jgi:UDP-N-acetyl-D-mannosaminuronic acid dehydrogenase